LEKFPFRVNYRDAELNRRKEERRKREEKHGAEEEERQRVLEKIREKVFNVEHVLYIDE